MIPVVNIGNLDRCYPSALLGIYDSVGDAIEAHPDAELRSDLTDEGDWCGGSQRVVIFDIPGTI